MNIHFVGIGGIGISGVAQFCALRGDRVTGSDVSESEIFPVLQKIGIPLFLSQKAENISPNTDLIVYSEAVSEQNPERLFAQKNKIPQKSYFQFLGEISRDYRVIAVAGSHGKTTTIGMIAAGFRSAGFDASVFVGSTLTEFEGSNFQKGHNEWMVVEACEYRQNFRFLKPEIVALTEIEWDHPDAYPTERHYLEAFRTFCQSAQTILFHADDTEAKKITKKLSSTNIPISNSEQVEMPIFGTYNQRNASLALEVARTLNLDIDRFRLGLQNFRGAGRRQEFLGDVRGIHIYDDYGHHPTEIKAVLSAFRKKFPRSKIGIIYEPHQFSRTRVFFDEFVQALSLADSVGLFPIYQARDSHADQMAVSIDDLIDRIPNAQKIETIPQVQSFISLLKKNDILLFMGAGKISQFVRSFLAENSKKKL
jgi:UDP-N-acetylmuramate--alanine ligase